MSRLDVIVFGATGFTGKHAVQELSLLSKESSNLKWGIAGRSEKKLTEILKEVTDKTGEDLSSVKIILADVGDESSLKEMCAQAKVLVNCCGPYRLYGEPVVKAAIDSKAHYVDVSGEPQFIETMQLKYGEEARDAGVYVVNACGFDSVPNDVGLVYLQQNFEGTLNSVESYLSVDVPAQYSGEGLINVGTWESLIYGLAHYNELSGLRKKNYPERLPTFKPKIKSRGALHRRLGGWCVPFPGADPSVMYRTQRRAYELQHARPAQVKTYVKVQSLVSAVALLLAAALLYVLAQLRSTRGLLLAHPRLFSLGRVRRAPAAAATAATAFRVDLLGEGWRRGTDLDQPVDNKLKLTVRGRDPGYGATVAALLQCALALLAEQRLLPPPGVLTPGEAFRDTSLVRRLQQRGLTFDVAPDH